MFLEFNLDFPSAAPEEIVAAACDDKSQRLDMAQLYNKVTYSCLQSNFSCLDMKIISIC